MSRKTRYKEPRETRTGVTVEADRFAYVIDTIRDEYDLTPEIEAEIEALKEKLNER